MKTSKFNRLTKVEKGLPKSGEKFLKESGIFVKGHTLVAGWYKGDIGKTEDYVVVLQSIEDETFVVLSRTAEGIKKEMCDTLYQTFLAHKAARFA